MFNASEHPSLYALILAPIKVYDNLVVGVNFLQCMISETAQGTAFTDSRIPSRIMKTPRIEVPRQLTVTHNEPERRKFLCKPEARF